MMATLYGDVMGSVVTMVMVMMVLTVVVHASHIVLHPLKIKVEIDVHVFRVVHATGWKIVTMRTTFVRPGTTVATTTTVMLIGG